MVSSEETKLIDKIGSKLSIKYAEVKTSIYYPLDYYPIRNT